MANSSPPSRATVHPGRLTAVAQARPDFAQQQVADLVAERVVDVLEVVEVHQQHGDRPGRGRGGERRLQPRGEHRAIGQAGERVAIGEVHDARFARRDVLRPSCAQR